MKSFRCCISDATKEEASERHWVVAEGSSLVACQEEDLQDEEVGAPQRTCQKVAVVRVAVGVVQPWAGAVVQTGEAEVQRIAGEAAAGAVAGVP